MDDSGGALVQGTPGEEEGKLEPRVLGQYNGVVKSFNEEKGFGFIMSDQLASAGFSNDAFLNAKHRGGVNIGDAVTFVAIVNSRGQPQAISVVPLSASGGEAALAPLALISGQLGAEGVGVDGLDKSQLTGVAPTTKTFFRGVIKSFSVKSNYGFIESERIKALGYHNDVYLTAVQMGECTVGDEVFFDVRINSSGQPQAKGIVALANKGPNERRGPKAPGPQYGECLGDFVGEVKSFSAQKGYGFVGCKELKDLGYLSDVFLHHTRSSCAVDVGDAVSFTAYLNDKEQPQARNVSLVGMGPRSRKRSGEDLQNVPVGVLKRAKMPALSPTILTPTATLGPMC